MRFDGKPVDEGILRRMTDSLTHRGPDDSGMLIRNQEGFSVGLGHRRLSIIDLSPAGHQPMTNEKKDAWIVYNGEVYNFPELRKDLEPRHSFISRTDTEVILHLYEEKGENCLAPLNGMFALAIWDENRRRLVLARDRIGKKPLYYSLFPDELVFASELKALLFHPRVRKEINPAALSQYLAFEYIPAPQAIFQGVNKLLPGYFLTFSAGGQKVVTQPYWDIRFGPNQAQERLEMEEVEARIRDLLLKSVEKRLISDVPLGVFLSGGIDSSTVVAMMSRLRDPGQIQTFTIGFREKSFDESDYGRRAARYFHTDHHEEVLDPRRMLEIFPDVARILDEPFADASIIPTYLLSRFTRQTVTVALGGDGGDELFAGYPTFQAHRLAFYFERFPDLFLRGLGRLAWFLPVSTSNISWDFRAKQFLKGISYSPEIRNQVWLGAFPPDDQIGLFSGDYEREVAGHDPYAPIRALLPGIVSRNVWDRLAYLYLKLYLAEDILAKVDRASMAVSLEVRAPFLDPDLVGFVNSLPAAMKIRGLTTKYILKRALKGLLPPEILNRQKKGFGIPVAEWIKGELKSLMLELLAPEKIRREGIFNPECVTRRIQEHLAGEKDNRKQLWTLIMFEMWRENYL